MKILILITFFAYTALLAAQVKPSVTYDPETGNYIIEYEGHEGENQEPVLVHRIFEPSTKIDPFVSANTIKIIDSNYYKYQFTITNSASSLQRLQDFDLEIFSSVTEVTKPDEFWKTSFYSFVPVFGWFNSKSADGLSHPLNGIAPDSSEAGFSFGSYGLPTITNAYLKGKPIIYLSFPDEPPDEISELLKPLRKFPNNTVIKKTIGPKDPPDPFIHLEFIDTLNNYADSSYALGWIQNQETRDKYKTHFNNASNFLELGDSSEARNELLIVLNECILDSSSVLTSESYALLRYNTEYLIEHLPVGGE